MIKHSIANHLYRVIAGVVLFALILDIAPAWVVTAASGVRYATPGGLTSGDCDTWPNACRLQTALGLAVSGEEVWAQQGVYKPTSGTDRTISFELKNGVAIYGGFAGAETAREQRDWETHVTVLSGDIDGNDATDPTGVVTDTANITGTNSYHVVTSSGVTETAVLDGFFITAGQANGTGAYASTCDGPYCGGGMYIEGGGPVLANLTFIGNMSHWGGGGLFNNGGNTAMNTVTFRNNTSNSGGGMFNNGGISTLTNVAFKDNLAWDSGGGMLNNFANPTLTNVTFFGNDSIGGGGGGGMKNYYSNPTLTNVTFSGNISGLSGGGIYNDHSNPVLVEVVFSGNSADEGGGMGNGFSHPTLTNVTFSVNHATYYGGGISNYLSNAVLTNVTFSGNRSDNSGGGMSASSSNLVLTNVIFSANTAGSAGGGMFITTSGSPMLINVTFSGNKAVNGGGLYNEGYTNVTLTNVTFSGNQADNGGGIFNGWGDHTLQNSILWGNTASGTGSQIYNDSNASLVIRFSLEEGCKPGGTWNNACGTDGGNNLPDADPLFVAPEPASSAPTTAGNYRLLPGSPAINVGDNTADLDGTGPLTATISNVDADLDGNLRIFNKIVDLGAYENQFLHCPTGGIFYVDATATDTNTGDSWPNAYPALHDALRVSEPCEIWVAEGVYYPDEGEGQADNDRTATFQLKSDVALYGGFAGTETAREQRDWAANITVLSGDIGVVGDNSDNSYHVVTGSGTDGTAVLDGFTVTGGNANGSGSNDKGGGMYNDSGSPSLVNVTFSGNRAVAGGGIANLNSSPTLTNVTFDSNQAYEGGGMYNWYCSLTLTNVTFSNNQASYVGGGMWNFSGNPTLTNVTFSGNKAASFGGGMANWPNSIPVLTNVIFSGNQADIHGGGMWNYNSSPVLTNVTFSDNTANNSGGGMYNSGSNPTFANVTFSANQANLGGGICNLGSSLTIHNSILWNNIPEQIFNESGSFTLSYSDLQGGCPAGGACIHILDADPLFVDAADGNLRLQPGSPAIDAGNNYSVTVATDLAGGPRFVDIPAAPDTGLGTPPLVDMGAYEANFVDVGILKTVYPFESVPGQTITYTLAFSNGGSLPAAGVIITDAVPAFVTIQTVSFGGVAITDTGHTPPYMWAVQELAAGQSGVITLTATLSEPLTAGVYANTAIISAEGDASAGNDLSAAGIYVLNVAPLAQNDSYSTLEDTPLHVSAPGVLGNDSDANGNVLSAFKNSNPLHGLLTINLDGSFVYTPTLNTNGSDSFTYHASDSALDSNIATVNLNITSVNDAPAGTNKSVTTLEDTDYTFATANFGFTDPNDNPANSFNRVKITTLPGQGTLKLNGMAVTVGQFVAVADITAGSLTFTPAPNANGVPYTSFTFQVEDDGGTAHGGVNLDPTPNTLTINVPSVNDAPVAVADTYTTNEDTPLEVAAPGILGNDSDVDGDALTAVLNGSPTHGLLTLNPDGTFVYTPTLNYSGLDRFTYHANDGGLDSNVVTVTIAVNANPVVEAGPDQSANEGGQVAFTGSFTDPGNLSTYNLAAVTILWDFGDGFTATGTLTSTHTYGDNGTFTVTLTVTDSLGAPGSDSLIVTVANVAPSLPVLPDLSVTPGETITLTVVFSDPGWFDTHTVAIEWLPGQTQVLDLAAGVLEFTASRAFPQEGNYLVTVTVMDKDGGSSSQSFTVDVKFFRAFMPLICVKTNP